MTKLLAIGRNTFLQTVRQPVFSVLVLLTFILLVLAVPLSGWTMSPTGEHKDSDQRLMNNVGLSTMLAMGLLVAAFGASSVLSREIDDGTALTVIAKPVGRATFVIGKYLGVAAAVTVAFYVCSLVFLMTVRHGVIPAASDPIDWPVIVIGCSALAAAFLIALVGNFSFGWTFTSSVIWTSVICLSLAMGAIILIGKGWTLVPVGQGIGVDVLLGLLLIYVGVLFFTSVAIAASTRLGQVPTLLVCIAVALLGAYHPLLFSWADDNLVLQALAWITPDIQYFMLMDALTLGRSVPASFVVLSVAYGACFIVAALAIGSALFQTRQLEGQHTSSAVPAPIAALAWAGRAVAIACLLAGLIIPGWSRLQTADGFLTAGGLLAGGVLLWLLWGFFARGSAWSYWLVLGVAALVTVAAGVALLVPQAWPWSPQAKQDTTLSIIALMGAAMVAVCILPRTRRHFRMSHRTG